MRATPASYGRAVTSTPCRAFGIGLAALAALTACTSAPSPSTPGASVTAEPTASSSPSPSVTPSAASCVDTAYAALSPEQRAGQLVMVALQAGSSSASLKPTIEGSHVGNMLYLGGWTSGKADVTATSGLLQQMATPDATGGIGLLVAADQEGGVVQQLKGDFTGIPSALTQGTWDPAHLRSSAKGWGAELKAAGVNLNLSPVADVVPSEIGKSNGPIGRWGRQFGSDPAAVGRSVTAFTQGMADAGVQTSVKHFPGIGRIRGNTDFASEGVDDPVMSATDAYLQPFVDGWTAGAGLVMMSSARYPQLDADNPAMFSPAIIDGMLRQQLGFRGVVITDDINAEAVRAVPLADRATRFLGSGGDILLTGNTPTAPQIVAAISSTALSDPTFGAKVETSVKRVLTLKASMGLVPGCSAA